jgi:anaerobic magnesium-protoporphyrin IX monomethyl ester cyclase
MTEQRRVLLINPQITSRRGARFPLSLLTLAGALEPTNICDLVDGNVDRSYLSNIERALATEHYDAVGLTVMGGPQVQSAIDCSKVIRRA